MLGVVELVLPLFGIVLIGFAVGKAVNISVEGLGWLNGFLLYAALPALFFRLLSNTPVSEFSNGFFIAATLFGTLAIFCFTFFLGSAFNRGDVRESTIQGFCGAYGNIGYMGPPLVLAAFGPQAGAPLALIFCFDNTLHFTMAPLLMSLSGEGKVGIASVLGRIFLRIFTHPFILATIAGVGFAWMQWELPKSGEAILDTLAMGAAPCALFAMGVTAALRPLERFPTQLFYLIPIKLIAHPLLILLLLTMFSHRIDWLWIQTAVLLAALPSAANVFVLAQQYEVWRERALSAVTLSTLVAVVSVTVWLYLLRSPELAAFAGY